MKTFLILIILLTTTIYSQTEMEDIQTKIEKIKGKYAPDKRTAIFNVQATEENGELTLSGVSQFPEANKELLDELKGISLNNKIVTLPSKELNDNIYGVINLSVANVRTLPDHHNEMATQALLGTPVKVYDKKSGYFYIQTPDHYIGWLDDDGVVPMNKTEFIEYLNSKKIVYTKQYGFSYSKADAASDPMSDLVNGNILKISGEEGNFYKVEFPDKRSGFVLKEEAKDYTQWVNSLKLDANNLISASKTLMGVPYLWGGTSTKGVDCSGFTKTIYYLNGLILPRDASQQVFAGDEVEITSDMNNLQPGDLLFFGSKAKDGKKERVTHVGMYLGDKDFIHSSGMVRINSFDPAKENYSPYRHNSLLHVKRIINSANKKLVLTNSKLFDISNYETK